MPAAIFPITPCQAPFYFLEIPEPVFICYLYTDCTYMFVFLKIFCSPAIRPEMLDTPLSLLTAHDKMEVSQSSPRPFCALRTASQEGRQREMIFDIFIA